MGFESSPNATRGFIWKEVARPPGLLQRKNNDVFFMFTLTWITDQRKSYSEWLKRKETNFVGRKTWKFKVAVRQWEMLGASKERPARWKWAAVKNKSEHEHRRQYWVKTYDNSSIKIMCNQEVWHFSPTKQRCSYANNGKERQKSVLHVQICFFW